MMLSKEAAKSLMGHPIPDRLMKLWIQGQPHNINIVLCYAPTSTDTDDEIDEFYELLKQTLVNIPRDIRIILGDFNVKPQ